jgi:capsular exopolysaccharide synthesis family protein
LLQAKSVELAAKEQSDVIDKAINDLQTKLNKLPSEKYIYTQLLRQNDVAKKRLEEIEVKLIESRMKGVIAAHITNIRVIDPPSLPIRPKFPNIPSMLLSSFLFGLCLAGIVVYLVEYFDDIIKGVDTLPKDMSCPFLGQLPYVHIGDLPTVYQESRSEYTESIHSLRTNLSFLALSGDRKLLLVTSPASEEGKSTITVNLAIAYAQAGRRVLLIDADIRNPSLHKYLARPKDPVGISNALIKEIDFYDVVQKSILGIVGFDYLPGGDVPPNPIQLIESDRMRELLETSQHIYDLVILDTPPLGMFSDALLLARYADVVTLVGRYNQTSRKELVAAIDLLKKTNVNAIGVVLNAIPSTIAGSYGYGYGYGYYGHGEDQTEKYAKGGSAA